MDEESTELNKDYWQKPRTKGLFVSQLERSAAHKASRAGLAATFMDPLSANNPKMVPFAGEAAPLAKANYLSTPKGCFVNGQWLSADQRPFGRRTRQERAVGRVRFVVGEREDGSGGCSSSGSSSGSSRGADSSGQGGPRAGGGRAAAAGGGVGGQGAGAEEGAEAGAEEEEQEVWAPSERELPPELRALMESVEGGDSLDGLDGLGHCDGFGGNSGSGFAETGADGQQPQHANSHSHTSLHAQSMPQLHGHLFDN